MNAVGKSRKIINHSLLNSSLLYLGRKYKNNTKSLKNRRVLVFGPTADLGIELIKELSARQADLIIASSDKAICKEIINTSFFESNIDIQSVDFTKLHSVAEFCDRLLEQDKPIDVFISCAEIVNHRCELTEDRIDITFQTNYLCHYLALIKLLHLIRKSRDGRIVFLTNDDHKTVERCPKKEFHYRYRDTLEFRKQAYQYSKFCLVSFAWKLSDLVNSPNLSVHCVNPGKYSTNPFHQVLVKSPIEAIQGILWAVLGDKPRPPFYIEGIESSTNYNRLASNNLLANILWTLSRKMCEKSHLTSTST